MKNINQRHYHHPSTSHHSVVANPHPSIIIIISFSSSNIIIHLANQLHPHHSPCPFRKHSYIGGGPPKYPSPCLDEYDDGYCGYSGYGGTAAAAAAANGDEPYAEYAS